SAHRTPRASNDLAFGWVLPSLQALHEALDALQRLFEERDGRGVADADVAAAAFPEGGAGDDGDFLFVEKPLGELHVAEAGRTDGGEAVEGALRLERRQADLAQAGDRQAAPRVEFGDELPRVLLAVADRFEGGVLRGRWRGHDDVLMDLHHRLEDVGWRTDPADAPTGHRVGFRETAKEDSALLHARQRWEARVLDAVREAVVDLVRDDDEVPPGGHLGDVQHIFAVHLRARRV